MLAPGGSGNDAEHGSSGEGGGIGGGGRPIGAYVVRDGKVSWEPAVDVNRVVGAATLILLTLFVSIARGRQRR